MYSLSRPVITVTSTGQGAQEDFDTADTFQDTYLQPLRIFDTVIGKIADVWALFSFRTELIPFHRYTHMQKWRWACCLVQLKYTFSLSLLISRHSSTICADYSSSVGSRCSVTQTREVVPSLQLYDTRSDAWPNLVDARRPWTDLSANS